MNPARPLECGIHGNPATHTYINVLGELSGLCPECLALDFHKRDPQLAREWEAVAATLRRV